MLLSMCLCICVCLYMSVWYFVSLILFPSAQIHKFYLSTK